jgi:hypothetical protein
MSIESSTNGSRVVKAGEYVFLEDQIVNTVNILAKGKLDVYISPYDDLRNVDKDQLIYKSYKLFSIDQSTFIGTNDLFLSSRHSFSYRASEDSIIFSYAIDDINGIEELFKEKNEYSTYVMNSIFSLIENSYESLNNLEQLVRNLGTAVDNLCLYFWMLKDKHGFSYEPVHYTLRDGMTRFQEIKEKEILLPNSFNAEFLGCSHFENNYSPCEEIDPLHMNYCKCMYHLKADLKKELLNNNFIIAQYNCTSSSILLKSILCKIKEALNIAEKYIETLYSDDEASILGEYINAGAQMGESIHEPVDMIEVQSYILSIIKDTEEVFKNNYHHLLSIDAKALEYRVETSINALKNKVTNDSLLIESGAITEGIPDELQNSAEQILEFSEISKDRYDLFMYSLNEFRELKDKLLDDEHIHSLRENIASVFFEVYESVFKRVSREKNQDRIYQMFLKYAYMDEKLLNPKNLCTLYRISKKDEEGNSVFNMKNWLQLIYNKEKNPSVNDFSLDYFDMFRELKKYGKVKASDKAEYENNVDKRLNFEIDNM